MDVNAILSIISTVGFPISVCLILFMYIYKKQEKTDDTIARLTETINNNTAVIQHLIDKLGYEKLGDE